MSPTTTVLQGHKVETANRKTLFMQQLANYVKKTMFMSVNLYAP